MRIFVLVFPVLLLQGCGSRSAGDLGARFDEAKEALVNQAQQTQTMGVQVGKVADKLAEVAVRLEATAGAQVGINNQLEQIRQEMRTSQTAGRDAVNTVVQYTREMMERDIAARTAEKQQFVQTILILSGTAVFLVAIFAAVAIATMKGSRDRRLVELGKGHLVRKEKRNEV